MKTTKTIVTNVKLILILSSLFLLFSCKNEEKQEWSAAMSRPFNYISSGQHVFYLKEGKIIGSCATLTDIGNFGWAFPQSARTNGYTDVLPDSVVVDYLGLTDKNEMWTFRGGMSLPTKLMDSLFKAGYIKNGKHENFRNIIIGLAPGGRICVWLDYVEIKRGIVPIEKKYFDYPVSVFEDSLEINNFLKHHPIDYSMWEKPDPLYELGFGFCSYKNEFTPVFLDFISKEGLLNLIMRNRFIMTSWGTNHGQSSILSNGNFYTTNNEQLKSPIKFQLPIHLKFSWQTTNKEKLYCTDIVLPKDFKKRFTTGYFDPDTSKKVNFNHLIFGVEEDGEHCIIWLDGPGKQEKLMRFKGHVAIRNESNGIESGGYATEVEYY
jgi:hypothetical protein